MADEWQAIDANERGSLTAVSTVDDKTIVRLVADPITGALLVTGSAGSGTVTSITAGTGLTGTPNPITTTGTIALDSKLAPLDTLGTPGQLIRVNAGQTALEYFTASSGGTPGGLNAQLQYNNAGSFGGISGATTDGSAVSLSGAHLLNPTINGAGVGLATLAYPNTASNATITFPATTGTVALTSDLTGYVTAVSGTASRITSTGGTTPVIDISASYVGQSSITTLGTITTGTLSTGAVIGGVTMTLGSDANYDMYYRNSSGILTRLANGTTGQFLAATTSNAPSWGTPSGSGTVNSGTAGQMAYYAGTGTAVSGNSHILFSNSVTTPNLSIGTTGDQGTLSIHGSVSGQINVTVPTTVSGTLTLPSATDTLVGKATTDTFTNKTYDTAGTGNSFSINGTAISAVTGSGSVVLATSPTLVTPTLGVATATRIGIGVAADASRLLLVSGDVAGGVATINRSNSSTNAAVGTVIIKGTSTGDMTDGFGSAFQFAIQDTAAVENLVGSIQVTRAGADNSGQMQLSTYNAGTPAAALVLSATQQVGIASSLVPTASDGAAIGSASLQFSDLFLASGAVMNWANGNVAITHSSGILTMGTGEMRITTIGTNTASVVTVGGAQSLTGKTYNGLNVTTTTGTLTLTNAKTLSVTNTLTLSGTDSTTMTFPTTSKTIAANDGSNLTIASQAIGDLLTATSTTAYGRLAAVATGSVLASAGTGTAPAWTTGPQVTTIELGAATDTTISRVSAGVIAVEGVTVATSSNTLTLTNKSIVASQITTGTFGTGAYTMDTSLTVPQVFNAENAQTASANAITFTRANRINKVTNNSAAGLTITLSTTSAAAGDMLIIKSVPSSAVAQTITWVNTENSDVTPSANLNPSTTSPRTDGFMWNSLTSKWRCVASA